MTEPLTPDAVRALIEEAEPHVVDLSSGWVCCDWCGTTREQECESCEKAWPCVTRRLADTLAAPIAEATPTHCPSCDGYQTAVMEDGQRSVGVCEGIAPHTVETAEEWEYGFESNSAHGRSWSGWRYNSLAAAQEWAQGKPRAEFFRRRPSGKREPVPPTEEPATARECGNDSRHGYGTGYCGDCTEEAADAD